MSEEHGTQSSLASWAIIVAFSAGLIVWGLVQFWLVPDAPREFDYGALKDVPGQSQYGIEESPAGTNVPKQIPPLPEAVPVKGTPKPAVPTDGRTP
jgi:hypothetical protein